MNIDVCTIYLARHGQTEANEAGIVQGQQNSELTALGVSQAEGLGNELAHIDFDAVYASDLVRARRTAEIAKLERSLIVATKEALRERNYGRFEGGTYEEIDRAYGTIQALLQQLDQETRFRSKPFYDVESDEELVSRHIQILREIAIAYAGKSVLTVSHAGAIRSLVNHLLGREALGIGSIRNAGYLILESDGVDFFVKDLAPLVKSS